VAESVLRQESSYYEKAKKIMPEGAESLCFAPYIKNYYAGAITDTSYEKYYSAPTKMSSMGIEFAVSYSASKVTFSNVIIDVGREWNFEGCEEVFFDDCIINGDASSIVFHACSHAVFRKCQFNNFKTYAVVEKRINKIEFDQCEFADCMYEYTRDIDDWQMLGGVIHVDEAEPFDWGRAVESRERRTVIHNCTFKNCGGRNTRCYYSSAVISNDCCEVKNSKFINCWNYNGSTAIDPKNERRTLFGFGSINEGNEIVGSADIVGKSGMFLRKNTPEDSAV
jgi:hypothetical protein